MREHLHVAGAGGVTDVDGLRQDDRIDAIARHLRAQAGLAVEPHLAAPDVAKMLRAAKSKSFHDLRPAASLPLVNYPRFAPDWVDWKVWLSTLGLGGSGRWRMETKSTYSQTIGDAIRGRGIALGSLTLLHAELAAGRLVRLSKDMLHSGRGYYLCRPDGAPLPRDAENLVGFLSGMAREQTSA